MSVVEDNNVCVGQDIYSTGDNSTYFIIVPFDEGYISLQFALRAPLVTGSHEYALFSDTGIFRFFAIESNSEQFLQVVGANWLTPESAKIEITDASLENIEGSFSFIASDGGNYSGTFQLTPIDHPL